MTGAVLSGQHRVEFREFDIPTPGHGEVLIRTKSSTICGSDIGMYKRANEFDAFKGFKPGVICGHEPCGIVEDVGPGMRRFKKGDRVIIYHISGCGLCYACRRGYMINCSAPPPLRAAYGWERDGGMAPFILAEEKDLVPLPDNLSFVDGSFIACGVSTAYEAFDRIGISGNDAVLVVGLGPLGLAALQLAKAMGANKLIGAEIVPERRELAKKLGLADVILDSNDDTLSAIMELTGGHGVEKAIDVTGHDGGRQLAIRATRDWGLSAFIGEGGTVNFQPSADLLHPQKAIHGSWVSSIWKMEELVERLSRWDVHPEKIVTHRFPFAQVGEGFALMADGKCGKVAIEFD